jgi:hypothetical protein
MVCQLLRHVHSCVVLVDEVVDVYSQRRIGTRVVLNSTFSDKIVKTSLNKNPVRKPTDLPGSPYTILYLLPVFLFLPSTHHLAPSISMDWLVNREPRDVLHPARAPLTPPGTPKIREKQIALQVGVRPVLSTGRGRSKNLRRTPS